MLPHLLSPALLAPSVLASLKDLAYCDPLRKDMQCPPDAAFGGNASFDFAQASWDKGLLDFWSVDNDTVHDEKRLEFGPEGMAVAVAKAGDAPTLTSHGYLLFGEVSVRIKAAPGRGLITALVLKSDSGDEIDWELLGGYENQASSNYFFDGKALFNTYNTTHALTSASTTSYHTYAITWTASELTFSIDGSARKTWRVGDIPAPQWPQTPMQVKLGVWSVAAASDGGEVQWAGGLPDWTRGAARASFQDLRVRDDVAGCDEMDAPVAYAYDERTWGWQAVRVMGCKRREGAALPAVGAGGVAPTSGDPPPGRPGESGGKEEEGGAARSGASAMMLGAAVAGGWLLLS